MKADITGLEGERCISGSQNLYCHFVSQQPFLAYFVFPCRWKELEETLLYIMKWRVVIKLSPFLPCISPHPYTLQSLKVILRR